MKNEIFDYVVRAFEYFDLKKENVSSLGDTKIITMFFDGKKKELGKIRQIFNMWKSGVSAEKCYVDVFLKKKCTKCGILKDRSCFHKSKANKDGLVNRCSVCKNEQNREFLSRPEVKKKRSDYSKTDRAKELDRNKHLKRTYGINQEEYINMYNAQDGKCAICLQTPVINGSENYKIKNKLHVDHDHVTGVVRDLLCPKCNTILGSCNDDVVILEKAIEYIKRHKKHINP